MASRSLRSGYALFLPVGVLLLAVNWMVSAPRSLFMDFRKSFYPGAGALRDGPGVLWSLLEIEGLGSGPFVMLVLSPLSLIPDAAAAGWVFFVAGVFAILASWFVLQRHSRSSAGLPLLALLFLCNGPLLYSMREGNTSHFVLLIVLLGIVAWLRDRHWLAGAALGFGAVLKLPLMGLLPFFLITRHWRIAAAFAVVVAGAFVLTTAAFGLDIIEAWYRHTATYARGAVGAYNAQTLDAFMVRLETGALHLRNYLPVPRSALHRVVRFAALAGLVAVLGYGIWQRARARDFDVLACCCVLVACLLVAPLAWSHYYALLFVPWGLYLAGLLPLPNDRTTRWLMGASFVLGSFPVLRTTLPWSWGAITSRTLVSFCFLGGVLALIALTRGLLRSGGPMHTPAPDPPKAHADVHVPDPASA